MSAPAYSERFDAAVALAIDAFRSHYRKTTRIPYVTHLLSVCATVGEYGGDEDQMIAAVLHDWLEDVPGADPRVLEDRFGARVRMLVEALTDTVEHPKPPWRPRKERYLALLRDEPADVKLISAADKLHNVRSILRDHHDIGDAVFDRFSAKKHETLWYFRAVCEALGANWRHAVLDELRDAVADLHRVAQTPI